MDTTSPADPTISPGEVAARRDDEDLFVLDVRRADEFEEWHVEGSSNLPIYDQLLQGNLSGLEAALDDLPSDREIAVVCVAGVTSATAAEFLRERGFDARSVADGMNGWGRVHLAYDTDVPGVTQVVRPGTGCVSYLVADGDEAVVVDPSLYVGEYVDLAADRGVDLVGAIDTHAHADHVSGGRRLHQARDVPYYLHEADGGSLTAYDALADGDSVAVGDRELTVSHTPGHTPGSVSLRWGDALLSGDTLFLASVGRPDLEDNDEAAVRDAAGDLFGSLRRLAALPDDTVVLPGHYSDESVRPLATTLDELATDNHLFGLDDEAAFVDAVVESLSETPANYQQIKQINWGEAPLTEEATTLELGPNNCAAN
ncbi:MAG: MBL fold metallo-hydrolase [Haloarculaceae archaeon]